MCKGKEDVLHDRCTEACKDNDPECNKVEVIRTLDVFSVGRIVIGEFIESPGASPGPGKAYVCEGEKDE